MSAILDFLEGVWDFISSLFDFLTSVVGWIADVISLPGEAINTITGLGDYFPSYFWTPLIAILGIVVIFRFLKIFQSGG